jgi:intracellular sulfur oxidation DsrE/DsrF family protein
VNRHEKHKTTAARRIQSVLFAAFFLAFLTTPVTAGEYAALKGVDGVNTVFDLSQGSPKVANIVFWAVNDVHQNESVRTLSNPPRTVVVFHGPSVKLISTERKWFNAEEAAEVDKFADTIRQMEKDGVTFEICDFAAKVMGVDPATIMPEIDHVGNGFVSVAGYQAQGYSVVRIP